MVMVAQSRRKKQEGDGPPAAARYVPRRPYSRALWLAVPAAAFLAVFFVYPAVLVLSRAFTDFAPPQTGGLDNIVWFFTTDVNIVLLRRTFAVSAAVTVIVMLLAFPYAYLMSVTTKRIRALMLAAVMVPFLTNFLVRLFALVVLLQDDGVVRDALASIGLHTQPLLGTSFAVAIGMAQTLLPLAVLPLYSVLQGIDNSFVMAARSLGAPAWKAFARIYLPLAVPGVLAGGLLVFVFGLGFYLTPALLGSPQHAMLAQQVVSQVQDLLAWGRGAVMGLVLLVVTLATLGLAAKVSRQALSAAYGGPAADGGGR